MPREEWSAGFVAFHIPTTSALSQTDQKQPTALTYLLLDHGRHWSFPKGHVEAGEDALAAAVRELGEETGIFLPEIVPDFRREIHYFFRHRGHGLVRKTVTYFLARVPNQKIVLSNEHVAATFLTFESALRKLTFASDRDVLRQAHAYLGDGPLLLMPT